MKVFASVLVLLFSVVFYSCSKEKSFEIPDLPEPPPPAGLLGKWNFVHLAVKMEAYLSIEESGFRVETVTRYTDTTTDNSGSITIEEATITGQHKYTIDTYAYPKLIVNGVETDAMPPMHVEYPIQTEAFDAPYIKVTADSLYFPQGAIFAVPSDPQSPTLPPSEPIGMNFAIRSDTLFLYGKQTQQYQRDANTTVTASGDMIMVYTKQP